MARFKALLFSIIAVVTLAAVTPVAHAQIVIGIHPHHRHYHHRHYHHHYHR